MALEDLILSILIKSPSDQYSLFRQIGNAKMWEVAKALAGLQQHKIINISGYRKSKRTGLDIPVYSLDPGKSDKVDLHELLAGVTSERLVEYDFVARCLTRRSKKARILDLGSAGSGLAKLIQKFGGSGWLVVGIDFAQHGGDVRMDARSAGFRSGVFDQVICISTVEHIGLSCGIDDENGDVKAMREISRILKNKGGAIVTIPYGKKSAVRDEAYRVYDRRSLAKLVRSFSIARKEFYRYSLGKWVRCSQQAAERSEGSVPSHFHSGASACLLLKKKHQPRMLQSISKSNEKRRQVNP